MEEQKYFFEVLKTRLSGQLRLVDVVEELLNLSTDAAYRRINGRMELSFSELRTLCQKFNISMDEIFSYQSGQTALFHYAPVNLSDQKSYIAYIKRLSESLAAVKSAPEKELYFTAQDIPFYHFLDYPELLFFKLYAWNDTLTRVPVSYSKFFNNLDKNTILPIYKQMGKAYQSIPSKEIWTYQTIDTVLRLLEYHFEIEAFDKKETILQILNQLDELMDTVKGYADDGYKGGDHKTPFALYISPVDLENNFMLLKKGESMSCNIKLFTVNSIAAENKSLCLETFKWIDDLISKSTLISGASGKERLRFFQSSKNKIEGLINKIELSS